MNINFPNRWFCFWWPRQPLVSEAIQALQEASSARKNDAVSAMLDTLLTDIASMKEKPSPDVLIDAFSSENTLDQAAAYYALALQGSKTVAPILHAVATYQWDQNDTQVRQWIKRTVRRIGQDTSQKLSSRASSLLCPRCLTRYSRFKAHPGGLSSAVYWGCRICQDSNDFLECKEVVALLDTSAGPEPIQEGGSLLVNWLSRSALFDFDRVLIRSASDAQIERFAVQVGNDTDPFRRERYREMICTVECPVTPNTGRILESIFGRVQQEVGQTRSYRQEMKEKGQVWLKRGI